MDILTDFITAAPTRKSWSTVYGYRPDKQTELKLLGEMFAVLSIKSDVEYDLANLGDLLLDELQAAYFKPTNEPAGLTDFEFALKAMNKRLETILEREEHLAKKGIDFEMMLAVIREGIIYLGVVGESKVVIARESDIAEISSALIDPDMEGFFRSGTLQLMSSDRILLLTSDAYKQLKQEGSEAVLNEFLLNKSAAKPKGSVIMLGYDLDADWLAKLEERNAPKQEPVPLDSETQEVESERLEDLEPITPEEHIEEQEEVEDYEQAFEEEFTEEDDYEEGEQYAQNETEAQSPVDRIRGAFATAKQKLVGTVGAVVRPIKQGKLGSHPLAHKGKVAVKEAIASAGATLKDIKNGRPGSRAEYMRGGKRGGIAVPQRWKLLGVIFLIAMVVVVFGVRQTIADNERRAYEQGVLDQIAKLEQDYSALEVRVNTVSIGTGQDAEKERIIRDLDQLKQKAEQLKSDQLAIDRIDKVIADSDKQKDTILKINAFSQAQVVTDLGVNFPDVNAVSLGYSQGQLYLLDKARGTIYRTATTIQSQAASFVTGLNSPKVMGVKEDGNLVFIDSGSESVVGVVDIATGDIRRQPGLSADRIGNVANIFIWPQNGSMYSINLTRNAIVRQSTVAGNYQIPGDGSVWRQDPEFANAIDLAVDGSVYVLVKGKGIQRYWGGEPATFTLGGMLSNIRQGVSDAVAFELTSTRIYVADAKNKRILIFALAPEGEANYQFLEQIVYRGSENIFNDIRDIVVVPGEQGERLFVLDGSKVIRIDR